MKKHRFKTLEEYRNSKIKIPCLKCGKEKTPSKYYYKETKTGIINNAKCIECYLVRADGKNQINAETGREYVKNLYIMAGRKYHDIL